MLGTPLLVVLDVCHLLKLVRNCWGDFKTLVDGEGNAIRWTLIENLNDLQASSGLHLANKLRSQHIDWRSNKMKTCLAAQTLSKSVAKSISYCDKIKNIPEFRDSDGTVNFVHVMNDLFDLLNSKSKFGKGSKAPLNRDNYDVWSKKFYDYTKYILSLKHVNGQFLVNGSRKSAFIGFIASMKSMLYIYQCYVLTNHLQYLLTFKFSQDHLGKFYDITLIYTNCKIV